MKRLFWGLSLLAAVVLAAACGGEPSFGGEDSFGGDNFVSSPSDNAPRPTATAAAMQSEAADVRATPAPAADSRDPEPEPGADSKVQASRLPQNRIIVHTATLSLVVEEVARAIDGVSRVSDRFGGWVVSANRQSRHSGSVSIRVPAQTLEVAIREIEALGLETEENSISSDDVTDEFVDSQSRLASMRATEQRLLSFLDQARDVDEALKVEREVRALQLQIEEIQGRINYLSEVAAYSLINVNLRLTPTILEVDAGVDAAYRIGQLVKFQASFVAPPDVDSFSFVWDFGDGATASGRGSALRPDGRRVTASVNHAYSAEGDYVASVTVTGTGAGGIAEGRESLLISVSEVPSIEVFAGGDRNVEEGVEVEYVATFTRPSELRDYRYQWEFGDGSATATGSLDDASTRLVVDHMYANYRPEPFNVQLTVSAESEVGRISGSDYFVVRVVEAERFVSSGWEISGTLKAAVRALTALAQVSLIVLIWVAVFSPVLLIGGGVVYLVNRRRRRFMVPTRLRPFSPPVEPQTERPGENEQVQPEGVEPPDAPAEGNLNEPGDVTQARQDDVEPDDTPQQPDTEERR